MQKATGKTDKLFIGAYNHKLRKVWLNKINWLHKNKTIRKGIKYNLSNISSVEIIFKNWKGFLLK